MRNRGPGWQRPPPGNDRFGGSAADSALEDVSSDDGSEDSDGLGEWAVSAAAEPPSPRLAGLSRSLWGLGGQGVEDFGQGNSSRPLADDLSYEGDAFSPRYMEDFDDRSEAAFSDASSQPSRASAAQTAKQGKQKMRQQLAQLREAEEQERQVAESRRPVFRFWRKAPDPPSRPAVTTTLEQDRAARAASRGYEAQVAEM
ncbi:unnamed protein product, partial [Polarella glacialis]